MPTRAFKIGDSVKVKADVLCPDDESVSLGGWQGRIIETEDAEDGKQLINIEWDSATLKKISIRYITDSEEEGLGWWEMWLYTSEVESVALRESAVDARMFRDSWASKFHWLGEGKQGERILRFSPTLILTTHSEHGTLTWRRCSSSHLRRTWPNLKIGIP